jgi:hypothetical protein
MHVNVGIFKKLHRFKEKGEIFWNLKRHFQVGG